MDMTNFIIFAISIIFVSILGYQTIKITDGQDSKIYKNYIYLGLVLFVDVGILALGAYYYFN